MTKETQMQFQSALKRLEKAKAEILKSHAAFQEVEKINFLIEIVKEQIQYKQVQNDENTDHSIR